MKIRDFIVEKIKKLYDEMGCEALIEIGLGKGVLTKKICQISPNFFVIEYDKQLVDSRQSLVDSKCNPQIILGDVLEVDVNKILKERKLDPKKTLIVGNLPYYITSPIFRKFFTPVRLPHSVRNDDSQFPGGIFMVQDEVGERISSETPKKSFLWWLLNYGYEVKYLKGVPAKAFKPAPKVKSAVVQLRIKNEELRIDWNKLFEFLDLYNGFARKTIGKIEKMVEKRFAAQTTGRKLRDTKQLQINNFKIPEELKSKRLEELNRPEISMILNDKG